MERELILQAKAGNNNAFEQLAIAYEKKIYLAAFYILRNMEDAKDICQEVLTRAYRNIKNFDESKPLYPWLHRIAKNLCLNHLKRSERRNSVLDDSEQYASNEAGPEALSERKEQAELIKIAIDSLSESHREILYLQHYEECSYAEIAEILSIPIGTVMSRLYNARKKLAEKLSLGEEI